MSCRYLGAADDVKFLAGPQPEKKGYRLNETRAYQYIRLNGPQSVFEGYGWSLDVLVEYTWTQLGALSTLLIILLVLEVRTRLHIHNPFGHDMVCHASICEAWQKKIRYSADLSCCLRSHGTAVKWDSGTKPSPQGPSQLSQPLQERL